MFISASEIKSGSIKAMYYSTIRAYGSSTRSPNGRYGQGEPQFGHWEGVSVD